MLTRLLVQNYALIEKTELTLQRGLNILTGETGAGKSLLVGAIGLILGRRADTSVLTDPDQKCVVEAEFEMPRRFEEVLKEAEIEIDSDERALILRREISPNGKTRAFINDTPVNLNTLKIVTSALVDLHSQHDGVKLMDPAVQLTILDQYAENLELTRHFAQRLSRLRGIEREGRDLVEQGKQAKQQLEYFRFQVNELEKAQLSVAEEEEMEQELALLSNAELIGDTLSRNTNILYDIEVSVSNQLADVVRSLEKIATLNKTIASEIQKIQDARYLIDDAASELHRLSEQIELDPVRLAHLNDRQSVLHHLKMKFGASSVAELLQMKADFASKLNGYESIDERLAELKIERKKVCDELIEIGLQIEARRKAAAEELQTKIMRLLPLVGLPKVHLYIDIRRLTAEKGSLMIDGALIQPESTGINAACIMIRTNQGMPYGALEQVASGGELSRVLLAIKAALAEKMELAVLIFDEIDTGISGEVALKVGRVMEQIAWNHQVITITHLPQIASRDGAHFFIYKSTEGDERAVSRVRQLSLDERIEEIAKIMSGENPSANALQSAKELMELS